jgi:hypothetical protein
MLAPIRSVDRTNELPNLPVDRVYHVDQAELESKYNPVA